MRWRNKFTDENGEPVTIDFKDRKGIKLLITKLKNRLINK